MQEVQVEGSLRNQDGEQQKHRDRQQDDDLLAVGSLYGSGWNRLIHNSPEPLVLSPENLIAIRSHYRCAEMGGRCILQPANQAGSTARILRVLMPAHCLGRKLFEHGGVGGLWLIALVKQQRPTSGTVRVGADPGVLVSESPGLNGRTSRVLQTRV